MTRMDPLKRLGRQVAAKAVLGLRGIDASRIHVDERHVVYVDHCQISDTDRLRIVLLSLVFLSWVSDNYDCPSEKAVDNPIYAADMRWLIARFGGAGGTIGHLLSEFLELADPILEKAA
ncbi:hypothetical protein [Ruegeria arenilitoris]|uniref:hypothetical protein n=1 Tax=Ruegeria arenilitoris TaxID=1173585 RepID=UPI00147DD6F2|nr:hypothetical protein [Ruegeria arenilitoris]